MRLDRARGNLEHPCLNPDTQSILRIPECTMPNQYHILARLTEEQINQIADRAVEKLEARVGRSIIKRTLLVVGLGVSALVSAALAVLLGK